MPLLFLLLPPPLLLPFSQTPHPKRQVLVHHLNTLSGSQRNGAPGPGQLDRLLSTRPTWRCSSQSPGSAPTPSISLRRAARLFRRGYRPCVPRSWLPWSSVFILDDRRPPSASEDLLSWYGNANAKSTSSTALSVSKPVSPDPGSAADLSPP
jgi:hypothetical protein